jgi:CRISPR/Cas system-associated endonuclease Cas3-HD
VIDLSWKFSALFSQESQEPKGRADAAAPFDLACHHHHHHHNSLPQLDAPVASAKRASMMLSKPVK